MGQIIGKMTEALEMLKGQVERKAEEVKKQMMDNMTASFESQVGIVISFVYETVKGLQSSLKTMSGIADETITHATSAATTEIADQISGIQNATEETVKSINDIVLTIKNIKDISIAIASAVGEQSSVTRGIAANVSEAASGTRVMSESISNVARDAEVTGEAAAKVLTNTNELSLQADKLQQEVDQFLQHLRSG